MFRILYEPGPVFFRHEAAPYRIIAPLFYGNGLIIRLPELVEPLFVPGKGQFLHRLRDFNQGQTV